MRTFFEQGSTCTTVCLKVIWDVSMSWWGCVHSSNYCPDYSSCVHLQLRNIKKPGRVGCYARSAQIRYRSHSTTCTGLSASHVTCDIFCTLITRSGSKDDWKQGYKTWKISLDLQTVFYLVGLCTTAVHNGCNREDQSGSWYTCTLHTVHMYM